MKTKQKTRGRHRNQELRDEVYKLRDKGLKQTAIALTLGVSQPWVSVLLKEKCPEKWTNIASAPKDGTLILAAAKPSKVAIWGMGLSKWDGTKWTGFTKQDQPTRWMQAPMPPSK